MRGSVVKKGSQWYVKIELDPDSATGRRRQKWHSGYKTKREAERARVDLLSKFDRGAYVEPSHQTVADFLSDWLKAIEHTVRPSTFDSYERNVRNHVIAQIGSVRLTKVDAGVLNGLYALLLSTGRRRPSRTGAGYSAAVAERAAVLRTDGLTLAATAERLQVELPEAEHITKDTVASLLRRRSTAAASDGWNAGLDRRTVNYVHTILHRAFKDAVRWGRLARNPADAADSPRGQAKSDGVHAATLRSFLESSRSSHDRLHAAMGVARDHGNASRRSARSSLERYRPRCKPTPSCADDHADPKQGVGWRAEDLAWPALDRARRGHGRSAARAPAADARRTPPRRTGLRRCRPRLPSTRRRVPASRSRQRDVRPPRSTVRTRPAHAARAPPHVDNPRARAEGPSESRARAPRPFDDRDHPRHLQPRSADTPRRGGCAGRVSCNALRIADGALRARVWRAGGRSGPPQRAIPRRHPSGRSPARSGRPRDCARGNPRFCHTPGIRSGACLDHERSRRSASPQRSGFPNRYIVVCARRRPIETSLRTCLSPGRCATTSIGYPRRMTF